MMPMRANIAGPPDVATRIKASMAACHSAASCELQISRLNVSPSNFPRFSPDQVARHKFPSSRHFENRVRNRTNAVYLRSGTVFGTERLRKEKYSLTRARCIASDEAETD